MYIKHMDLEYANKLYNGMLQVADTLFATPRLFHSIPMSIEQYQVAMQRLHEPPKQETSTMARILLDDGDELRSKDF